MPVCVRGFTAPWAAAGLTGKEWIGMCMSADPIVSKTKMPEDHVPLKLLTLTLDLLKSNELPEMAIGGAWCAVYQCGTGRPSFGLAALEGGVYELAVAQLHAIGSPADWISISRGKAGRAWKLIESTNNVPKAFAGSASRPDLEACVASGLFDMCLEAVVAVAAAGVGGLSDTNHGVLCMALSNIRATRAYPGCEPKIRSVLAGSLAFCLINELDYIQELGLTSATNAAQMCETHTLAAEATATNQLTLRPPPRRLFGVRPRRRWFRVQLLVAARRDSVR